MDAKVRKQVAACADNETFAEIIKYIDEHPDCDRIEVLGRWAGREVATELGRLADRAPVLSDAAIVAEIAEGPGRLSGSSGQK